MWVHKRASNQQKNLAYPVSDAAAFARRGTQPDFATFARGFVFSLAANLGLGQRGFERGIHFLLRRHAEVVRRKAPHHFLGVFAPLVTEVRPLRAELGSQVRASQDQQFTGDAVQ